MMLPTTNLDASRTTHNHPRPLKFLVAASLACLFPAVAACDSNTPAAEVCKASSCAAAPIPTCDGNKRLVYAALGTCTETGGTAFSCDYPIVQQQDCTAQAGRICSGGQCVTPLPVPCAEVVCNDPPAPDCDGETARIYAPNGTCDPAIGPLGTCVYPVDSTLSCPTLGRECRDGGCPDPSVTPCDPNPCTVPPAGKCAGGSPQRYAETGTCTRVGTGVTAYTCEYSLNEFAPCTGTTPICGGGACAKATRAPTAGEIVFHELLINPPDQDDLGEWIELFNLTPDALSLTDCLLKDDGNNRYTFTAADKLLVPAQGFAVIGRSAERDDNGGFVPNAVYANFQLGNSKDVVELICGGVTIDRVAWDSETWPVRSGASMSLRAGQTNAAANDNASSWCLSNTPYGNGRADGTPRAANGTCVTP